MRWRVMAPGAVALLLVGLALSVLPVQAQSTLWFRQFGTAGGDAAFDAAVDSAGNVYVAGRVAGTLPGETSSGGDDAFVRKYSPDGTVQWTRQFGSSAYDQAFGVAAHGTSVYVVGRVDGPLPGQTSAGGLGGRLHPQVRLGRH